MPRPIAQASVPVRPPPSRIGYYHPARSPTLIGLLFPEPGVIGAWRHRVRVRTMSLESENTEWSSRYSIRHNDTATHKPSNAPQTWLFVQSDQAATRQAVTHRRVSTAKVSFKHTRKTIFGANKVVYSPSNGVFKQVGPTTVVGTADPVSSLVLPERTHDGLT